MSVDVRPDEAGLLQPVLEASWKLKDDGEWVCGDDHVQQYIHENQHIRDMKTLISISFSTIPDFKTDDGDLSQDSYL